MKKIIKAVICLSILLLMMIQGCMTPLIQNPQQRVPSPTSAVLFQQTDIADDCEPSSEEIKLLFTEVKSSGDFEGAYAGCEEEDWFELYNSGMQSVNLSRLFITNDPNEPDKYRLPKADLAPGEYLAICCCENIAHPSVDMGIKRSGETLYIYSWDKKELCHVVVPPLDSDLSWGKMDGIWGYCTDPTPGRANEKVFSSLEPIQVDTLGISVSELLIDSRNAAYNDGTKEFVELHNDTEETISLHNWYLSDSLNNLKKWPFPDKDLAADGYLVVLFGSNKEEHQDGSLKAGFSLNRHENVYLFDANKLSFSVYTPPQSIRPDVSVGPNGEYYFCPTPGQPNGPASYTIDDKGLYDYDGIFISEVCAYAGAGNNDWIELYNASEKDVHLNGWKLTKSREGDEAIPLSGILPSGGYAVFETTSHDERQSDSVGSFGLSMAGETLFLQDDTGALRDEFATGALEPYVSSGRVEGDGGIARVFFKKTTKGGRNSRQFSMGYAKAPVFSDTSLYHTAPFDLTLTSGPAAVIRYTTNGSEPTTSSSIYSGPISINKNTVIRAFAQEDGLLDSETVTYTYLFEEPHELPVVCVSLKPKDLDALLSARSKVSASKAQRKGYFSYYENGKLATDFPADIKTKGAGTLGYNQLSLTIHLRGEYGQGTVTYPFFKEYGWREYSSLCIRNSGQDLSQARIRDSFASRLCIGLNIDVAATRPVAVYINGKYYGLYDLNEDQNDDYLENHFGIDKKQVEIIRYNERVVKGTKNDWRRVINYAKEQNFAKDSVYEKFIQWVDPDYFIDYLVCSTYLCNVDMANQKYWHTKDNVIRWRAIFYDFDYAMGFDRGSVRRNILKNFFSKSGTHTATDTLYTYIPAALVRNNGWKNRFIERYVELTVTTFAPERAVRILNELRDEMAPEMSRQISRWGRPASYAKWEENLSVIQEWMEMRPVYALENLRSYFKLDQSYIDELVAKYTPVS